MLSGYVAGWWPQSICLPAAVALSVPRAVAGAQKINRIFVPILLVMALSCLVHLQALGVADSAVRGIDMMLYMVVFLVRCSAAASCRFFTQAVVPGFRAGRSSGWRPRPWALFPLLILLQLV